MRRLPALNAPMTPRRTLVALASAAVISLGSSLAIQASAQQAEQEAPPQVAQVVWDFRPDSVGELARGSASMVYAEVRDIRAGEPLVADADGHPEGDQTPTQRITLDTVRHLQGKELPSSFELFRTGSEQLQLEGDPPYELGERYVLFVTEKQDEPGTYIASAPDGRLLEDARGRLEPLIEGPVGEQLDGDTPREAERQAEREESQ